MELKVPPLTSMSPVAATTWAALPAENVPPPLTISVPLLPEAAPTVRAPELTWLKVDPARFVMQAARRGGL